MQLTWTFYPKDSKESVTLTVIYVPELDAEKLPSGGFLGVVNNVAYVDWTTYRVFDQIDLKARRDAFARLIRITKTGGILRADNSVIRLPKPTQ